MMVKVCGITNAEDAHVAVEEGVSALGFVFHAPSPRSVSIETSAEIIAGLPRNIWKVGVFVNQSAAEITRIALACKLDVAQLHGDETPADIPEDIRVWKALRVSGTLASEELRPFDVEAFVLDTAAPGEYGGTGRTFPWHLAKDLNDYKIILAGGLDSSNVREAIREARPWGVDASSRLEKAPGRKDHGKLCAFLKAALSKKEL
jgi:phosphoribosylanthranilate isomerase